MCSNFSKHRPSGPMLSVSRFVHISVCVCVCLFTFEVPFNGLFAPTSRSRMSNIFRDSESLGKSNRKMWSQIWTFLFGSGLKSPRKKKFDFVCWFCLTKHGGNHASRWIRDLWSKGVSLILAYISRRFWLFAFWMIFSLFQKKIGFRVFLVHPTVVSVLLSASVERCFVSRMRDFYLML